MIDHVPTLGHETFQVPRGDFSDLLTLKDEQLASLVLRTVVE
jgi:hypothetical protein